MDGFVTSAALHLSVFTVSYLPLCRCPPGLVRVHRCHLLEKKQPLLLLDVMNVPLSPEVTQRPQRIPPHGPLLDHVVTCWNNSLFVFNVNKNINVITVFAERFSSETVTGLK